MNGWDSRAVESLRHLAARAESVASEIEAGRIPYGRGTVDVFVDAFEKAVRAWREAIRYRPDGGY
jgi:hypothetical protein